MGEYNGVEIFSDQGRIKARCTKSSSGATWVGLCKYCKDKDCAIVGVPKETLENAV